MTPHDERPFRDFCHAIVAAIALKPQVLEDGWPRFHLLRWRKR